MAKQLNIFVENKPGRLTTITEMLFNAGFNIRAFTIQDRGDFGLVKLLVDRPDEAHRILTEKGLASALKNIIAVSIKDKPGNLSKLVHVLSDHKINIRDTYGFVVEPAKEGICCIEVENDRGIKGLLEKAGFKVLDDLELYEYR